MKTVNDYKFDASLIGAKASELKNSLMSIMESVLVYALYIIKYIVFGVLIYQFFKQLYNQIIKLYI